MTSNNILSVYEKLGTIIVRNFFFYFNFFQFRFSHEFRTIAAFTFAHGSKNLFSHTVQILSKSITCNRVDFSFFKYMWVILSPRNFSRNLKLHVRYFFYTPYNILGEKKSKIVKFSGRPIWAGIPDI